MIFPSDIIQLLIRNPKVFPGQMGDIIPQSLLSLVLHLQLDVSGISPQPVVDGLLIKYLTNLCWLLFDAKGAAVLLQALS